MIPINPEAIGDPNQTPVVYLGEENGRALGIPQRTATAEIIEGKSTATLFIANRCHAVAWGPAVDNGDWFVRVPPAEGYRVAGRDAAWDELNRLAAAHLTVEENIQ